MFRLIASPRPRGVLAVVTSLLAGVAAASAASDFDGFDPNADGNIYAVALQPDGKVLLGGGFSHLQPNQSAEPAVHFRIARLNPDGSVDEAFHAGFDGDVTSIALQSDGKIIVGGRFTSAASGTQSWMTRNGLARILPDGTIDTTFDARLVGAAAFPLGLVRTLAVQADDKILVGGGFTSVQPLGAATPTDRNRLLRLNADGTLDTAFNPNANNVVLALAVQSDGRIVVGGGFTTLAGSARLRLARLNADGSLDASFDPQPNNRVLALALQADGAILVGGDFRSFTPGGSATATERTFVARLTPAGAIDSTFNPAPGAAVEMIAVQFDGRVLIGGRFTWVRPSGATSPTNIRYLARFHPGGALDDTFFPNPAAQVAAVAQQSDGRLIIGGYFTSVRPSNAGTAAVRNRVARLQTSGEADTPLLAGVTGTINAVVRQPDGRLLIGGSFATIAGVSRANLARLNADGTLDRDFAPDVQGAVSTIALQSDGAIVIAGSFSEINDTSRTFLARLTSAGELDTAFNPNPNSSVSAVLIQADGKIIIGGGFTTLLYGTGGAGTDDDDDDDVTRNRIARLNANGTADTTFNPNANGAVTLLYPENGGTILIGGNFSALQPNATGDVLTRGGIARLNADGSVATAFNPNTNGAVQTIALQADGRYVIGGTFTQVTSTGSTTIIQRNRLARMDTDGMFDTIFDPSPNSTVSSITVLPGQRLLLAGTFSNFSIAGSPAALEENNPVVERDFLAMVSSATGTVDTTFTLEPNSSVSSVLVEPAGTVLLAGPFNAFTSGSTRFNVEHHLVRLNAATNSLDASFRPRVDAVPTERVTAIALEEDGRILLGGEFAQLSGSTRANLLRLLPDGIRDGSFSASTDGAVNAVLRLPDPVDRTDGPNKLAWLNSNGTLRGAFDHADTELINGDVRAVALQSDGKLIVGGSFSITGAVVGSNLVRFNADGSLDTTFSPAPNNSVEALVVLSDNRILVGGTFTEIGANAEFDYMARLSANGTLDTAFKPAPNSSVFGIALQSDGKILIGGAFTTVQPPAATSAVNRTYLAKLNADGTLDTGFNPTLNGTVNDVAVQPSDGRILVGGAFTVINGTSRAYLARLAVGGDLDTDFNPVPNAVVRAITIQADNQILVGGDFTAFQPNSATEATARQFLARLATNGTLDDAFAPTPNSSVGAIAVQSDGRIVIGGAFTALTPNGASDFTIRFRLARLNTDGTLDPGFNPISDGQVNVIVTRTDGSIIIGGNFTELSPEPTLLVGGAFANVSGSPFPYLARLNTDGSADAFFQPQPDGAVFALASTADGRALVGGAFTTLGGLARTRLALLSADGTVDPDFAPAIDGAVHSLAVQPDGRVVLGGVFTTVGGAARGGLARLLADGTIDASFSASANGSVAAIVVQADGRLLIAGEFTTVNGTARNHLARLNADGTLDASFNPAPDGIVWALALQANGSVLVGGEFANIAGSARARFARLTSSGALDATVAPAIDGAVYSILLHPDGRPFVGGAFANIGTQSRYLIARLPQTQSATQSLTVSADLADIVWTRGGAGVEFQAVIFAQSTDGTAWTDLGPGVRTGTAGVWQLTGATLPANTNYFVRATGELPSSRYGSGGRAEVIWQFYNDKVAGWAAYYAGGAPAGDGGTPDEPSGGDGSDGGDGSGGDGGSGGSGGDGGGGSPGSGDPPDSNAPADTVPGLVNFSTRAQPDVGTPLITGFVIGGSDTQRVLLRAIGPGLKPLGVTGEMTAPWIQLFDGGGNLLDENAGWGGDAALADAFTATGAFALDPLSTDSALLVTLAPGAYTMHVRDASGVTGIALNEVYVADNTAGSETLGLANLSTRGPVGSGAAVLIGGFAIGGDQPRRVLVRGIGPGLLGLGVPDAIADPHLRIYNVKGEPVAENDNWQAQSGSSTAADLVAAFGATGAFALNNGSTDAALILTLEPGTYTAHVSGTTAGTALVEVYEMP